MIGYLVGFPNTSNITAVAFTASADDIRTATLRRNELQNFCHLAILPFSKKSPGPIGFPVTLNKSAAIFNSAKIAL